MSRDGKRASSSGAALLAACAAYALVLPAASQETPRVILERAEIAAATRTPDARARAQRLQALIEQGAVEEITAEIERLSAGRDDTIVREWLLNTGLHGLAHLPPTPAARALVARLAQRPAAVLTPVDPDHGAHAIPLYDPAATARFVLASWERNDARLQATAALAARADGPMRRFAQKPGDALADPVRAGILDAVAQADLEALAGMRAGLITGLSSGLAVGKLASIVAARLHDAELHSLAIARGDAAAALDSVMRTRAVFGDSAALPILVEASRRADVRSAALLQIGHLAASDGRARAALFEALDDAAAAPSAAAALGRLRDPSIAAEVGARLQQAPDEQTRRHLVLALRLDDSHAARAELQQFLSTRHGSPRLRKEVRAWLAR